jgi:hypothetical protein
MNRRHFLAASTAAATLASAAPASARQSGRLKVIVPAMEPAALADLKAAAPGVDLVECRSEAEAIEQAPGAAASYAFITAGVIRASKSLKWVQQPSAGVEGLMEIPELVEGDIVLTNMQRAYAPEIADQSIGYLWPSPGASPISSAFSRASSGDRASRASCSTSCWARRCWSSGSAASGPRSPAVPRPSACA